jgi:hypothetical protein
VLANSRLRYDHPIGELLEDEAEIVGSTAYLRVLDEHGGWIMLGDRIAELKADPRFRECIPNPAKVPRSDEPAIRDSFDEITNGRRRMAISET